MLTPLRLEFLKLLRARSFHLSFVVLFGFVVLMLWGFYSYVDHKTGGQAAQQFKYTYESKSYFNGTIFALYSVIFSFNLLLPIFVAMTAGAQIAGEARAGTLRMMLVRPRGATFSSPTFPGKVSIIMPASAARISAACCWRPWSFLIEKM